MSKLKVIFQKAQQYIFDHMINRMTETFENLVDNRKTKTANNLKYSMKERT